MMLVRAFFPIVASVTLLGCSVFEDRPPDYRFRLTVEVETPWTEPFW
jgi:hypothetical protein